MSMMRCIMIENAGPEGRLVLSECPIPTPQDHEVLIRVAYAGINRADVFQRLGMYPAPEGASPIPGLEVSGSIAALGTKVSASEWTIGQSVCALTNGGGYAEYVAVPVSQLLPIPNTLGFAEAAALPEACFTVWMALVSDAHLVPSETVLIQGGTSGIGTIAIPLLTHYGAKVIATASTPEKCERCEQLGAIKGINYKAPDLAVQIKALTSGRGVDVVLDMLGGDALQPSLSALAVGGRMVSIAFLNGAQIKLNMASLLMKQLTWKGLTLRNRSSASKAKVSAELMAHVWPSLEKSAWKPLIDSEFLLENAQEAQKRMEDRLHLGKIVLKL